MIAGVCTCTGEYGIKKNGFPSVPIEGYCDYWDNDGPWCYLAGGLKAEMCPGALLSSGGDKYWTKDETIFQAAEGNRKPGR